MRFTIVVEVPLVLALLSRGIVWQNLLLKDSRTPRRLRVSMHRLLQSYVHTGKQGDASEATNVVFGTKTRYLCLLTLSGLR